MRAMEMVQVVPVRLVFSRVREIGALLHSHNDIWELMVTYIARAFCDCLSIALRPFPSPGWSS